MKLLGTFVQLTPSCEDEWAEHIEYLNDARTMEHLWFLSSAGEKWTEDSVRKRLLRLAQ
jgi:hypothetical protein